MERIINFYTDFSVIPNNLQSVNFFCQGFCDYFKVKNSYQKISTEIFNLTDINNAEFVVIPINWEWILKLNLTDNIKPLINIAHENGKPIVIFYFDDDAKDIEIEKEP